MGLFSIVPANLRAIRGAGGADIHLHLAGRFPDDLIDARVRKLLTTPLWQALADRIAASERAQLFLRLREEHRAAEADLDGAKAEARKLATEKAYLESSCPPGAAARLAKVGEAIAAAEERQAEARRRADAVKGAMQRAEAAAVAELNADRPGLCQEHMTRLQKIGDTLRAKIEAALGDDVLLDLTAATYAAFVATQLGGGVDVASVLAAAKPAKGDGQAADDLDAAAKLPGPREPAEAVTVSADDADDEQGEPVFIHG